MLFPRRNSGKGRTFLENARSKSLYYGKMSGLLTLAEDSGLEVDALGGAPGIHSGRFSRPNPTDAKNIRKVLRLPRERALERPEGKVCLCDGPITGRPGHPGDRGEVRGVIDFAMKGRTVFGYDPIFFYPRLRRHFAELGPDERMRSAPRPGLKN